MFYWRDISSAPNQFLLFAVPRRIKSILAFARILQVSQRKFSSSSFLNFRLCPWQNNRSFSSCVLWSHCGEASMRKSLTKDQQASWGQIEGGGAPRGFRGGRNPLSVDIFAFWAIWRRAPHLCHLVLLPHGEMTSLHWKWFSIQHTALLHYWLLSVGFHCAPQLV